MQSGRIQELTRLQEDLLGDQPKLKYKDLLTLDWEGVLKGACLTNTEWSHLYVESKKSNSQEQKVEW